MHFCLQIRLYIASEVETVSINYLLINQHATVKLVYWNVDCKKQ